LGFNLGEDIMDSVVIAAFALSVAYAVIGNAAVYVILRRRQVPVRHMWAGTPTYLYRVCRDTPEVGARLRRFAASTDVVFVWPLFWYYP
jgi:hypothetical protein